MGSRGRDPRGDRRLRAVGHRRTHELAHFGRDCKDARAAEGDRSAEENGTAEGRGAKDRAPAEGDRDTEEGRGGEARAAESRRAAEEGRAEAGAAEASRRREEGSGEKGGAGEEDAAQVGRAAARDSVA